MQALMHSMTLRLWQSFCHLRIDTGTVRWCEGCSDQSTPALCGVWHRPAPDLCDVIGCGLRKALRYPKTGQRYFRQPCVRSVPLQLIGWSTPVSGQMLYNCPRSLYTGMSSQPILQWLGWDTELAKAVCFSKTVCSESPPTPGSDTVCAADCRCPVHDLPRSFVPSGKNGYPA